MRRSFFQFLLFLFLTCLPLRAAEYKLADGTVLSGRPASMNEQGVSIELEDGTITKRTPWNKFHQQALKKFAAEFANSTRVTPATKVLINSLILPDPPLNAGATNEVEAPLPVVPEVIKAPRAALVKVEGFERPLADPSFFAALSSSMGFLALLLLIGANFYAAYEVALFKDRSVALVMGVSVVPIIGPLVFFCMPPRTPKSSNPEAEEVAPAETASQQAVTSTSSENPDSIFYRSGEMTINRRFIETKLAGFMKMVPSGDYKNLWLAVRTADGEFWTQNITKTTQESMTVKTPVENVWDHREISYFQIKEMEIRRWVAEES